MVKDSRLRSDMNSTVATLVRWWQRTHSRQWTVIDEHAARWTSRTKTHVVNIVRGSYFTQTLQCCGWLIAESAVMDHLNSWSSFFVSVE